MAADVAAVSADGTATIEPLGMVAQVISAGPRPAR